MSDYIKVCATCDHYPNDKHCIGCEWDKKTGDNTKWESKTIIDRKVIEDIKTEIEEIAQGHNPAHDPFDGGYTVAIMDVLNIIDKHCGKENK